MKGNNFLQISSLALIGLSALSLLSVSAMAFFNPQLVMDLVGVTLPNADAYSSIRGVYGGVGLTLVITLTYLALTDAGKGLLFLALLWGFYALSRVLTILKEGELGAFGSQWLVIEGTLCALAVLLLVLRRRGSHRIILH